MTIYQTMFSFSKLLILLVLVTPFVFSGIQPGWGAAPASDTTVVSPNGKLRAIISFSDSEENRSAIAYEVAYQGKAVLISSSLELKLADGSSLGRDCRLVKSESRQIDETFRQFPGKRTHVDAHCNELIVFLAENSNPARQWQVVLRAYDDGIAIRYRVPQQDEWHEITLASEQTQFSFPADARAVFLPLPAFVTSHENDYQTASIGDVPEDQLLGIPLLVEVTDVGWAAITEADLKDYAGMFLSRVRGEPTLVTTLSPRVDLPDVAVRTMLPLETPWRVIFFAEKAKDLIESYLPLKLNPPSVIADTSWIMPGKTTFPWWNGFYEENIPVEPGLNTEFAKYYIDFCGIWNPLSFARWFGQHRLVRRDDRPLPWKVRHHERNRRPRPRRGVSPCQRKRSTNPALDALASSSGKHETHSLFIDSWESKE